jgi:hypothetical protein
VYRKIAATAAVAALAVAVSCAVPSHARAQSFRLDIKADIRIASDRSVTETFHHETTPLVESAVRGVAQTRWTVTGNQTFEILEAFTRKADGTVVNADPKDFVTQDGSVGLAASFGDVKVHQIPFRDVALGDTTVLTVRIVEKKHYIPGQYSQRLLATPTSGRRNLDVTLRAPADLAIRHDRRGLAYEESREGDEVVRHWSGSVDPVTTSERNVVDLYSAVPGLRFSTFPNFEAVATAYYDGAKPMLAVTSEIERLAAEITAGKTGAREQTQAIFDWVSRNIRYVNVTFGNGRYVPNDTHTILARRFGDCKDHAVLLSALLAAKGIDSEQVLIGLNAEYRLPKTPLLQAFNHVIVYVPALDRYLDPTVAFGSFAHLPIKDLGKPVVRVSEHGATLARTPAPGIDDNVVNLDTRVTMTRAGRQQGRTTIEARGGFADLLRAFLEQAEVKGKDVQMANLAKLRGVGGTVTLEGPPWTDTREPVRVTTGWDMQQASDPVQTGWRLPPGLSPMVAHPSLFFGNFDSHKRVYPAGCGAGKIVHNIELTLPAGITPGPLPMPIVQTTPLFSFKEAWSADSHHVRVKVEASSSATGRVCTPDQIDAVRAAYGAMAKRVYPVLRLNAQTHESAGDARRPWPDRQDIASSPKQ